MSRPARLRVIAFLAVTATVAGAATVAAQADPDPRLDAWPQWRGPLGTGEGPRADPPTEWSEKKNIRWKTELPGSGHGSPVVYGDRAFVTAAVPYGEAVDPVPDDAPGAHDNAPVTRRQDFVAMALSRKDGKVLWRKSLRKQLPHAGAHKSGTLASASPVVDGEHVFAYFGSNGLYCLDHAGELIWTKDLGDMQVKHGHGEGSSAVLHGDTLVVNWDHEGPSFLVAFDKATGDERWRVEREEVTSWATPIVVEHKGTKQLIVSGTKRVRSYDLASGKVIWECGGLSHNVVASPVAADGLVIVASSYEKRAMFAIRLDGAKGDVTDTDHVVWFHRRRTPYVPSPLLYRGQLYFLNHYQGVLSRIDAKSGKETHGPFRLNGVFELYSSPVAAAGRVYLTDRDGTTVVISHTEGVPDVLAVNKLEDGFNATAALAGKELFLRGTRYLYCIAEPPSPAAPAPPTRSSAPAPAPSSGTSQTARTPPAIPITGKAQPRLVALDRFMLDFMQTRDVPGGALAVTYKGRLVYDRGFGYADLEKKRVVEPSALFRIASISKPFTAVAVLQLAERGKLQLDDKVAEILTLEPFGDRKVDERLQQVTIRQLLQHRGGWSRDASFDPMFRSHLVAAEAGIKSPAKPWDVIRYMTGRPLDFAPGAGYTYSNYGYCLLGRVIEKLTGKTYAEFVTESVLLPVGIRRMYLGASRLEERRPDEVRYYGQPHRKARSVFAPADGLTVPWQYGGFYLEAMDSHGGWIASASDLLRFARDFDDPATSKLLEPESIRAMFARPPGFAGHTKAEGGEPRPNFYACGWNVLSGKSEEHGGSLPGTTSKLVRRADGIDWVVLFNTRRAGRDAKAERIHPDHFKDAFSPILDGIEAWPGAEVDLWSGGGR